MKRLKILLGILVVALFMTSCSFSDAKEKEAEEESADDEDELTPEERAAERKEKREKRNKEKEKKEKKAKEEDKNEVFHTDIYSVFVYEDDVRTSLFANTNEVPGTEKVFEDWNKGMDGTDCSVSVIRSDSNYLSFLGCHDEEATVDEDSFYSAGSEIKIGYNYETATGKEVKLEDIVADEEVFRKALEGSIFETLPEKWTGDDVRAVLDKVLFSGNTLSCHDISWTIGYEGITVYFDSAYNFNFYDSGEYLTETFFVPYAGNEDAFIPEVISVPETYAVQINTDDIYGDTLYVDPGHKGDIEKIEFSLRREAGEDEDERVFTGFKGESDDRVVTSIGFEECKDEPKAYYVRTAEGEGYVYVQTNEELKPFNLYYEPFGQMENIKTVQGMTLNYLEYSPMVDDYGMLLSWDPAEFFLEKGYNDTEIAEIADLYSLDTEGEPVLAKRKHLNINPLRKDNIWPDKNEDGETIYYIKDDNEDKEYIIDKDTKLIPYDDRFIAKFEKGKDTITWIEEYLGEDPSSGLGFGMGDVFNIIVNGDHVDEIYNIYWWD